MKLSKLRITNFRSIKDTENISLSDNVFILAGQNESGKSSILEALNAYQTNLSSRENLNFELENEENLIQEISCTYQGIDKKFWDNVLKDLKDLIITENSLEEEDVSKIFSDDFFENFHEFTITRTFNFKTNFSSTISIDKSSQGKFHKYLLTFNDENIDNNDEEVKESQFLDPELYNPEIAEIFLKHSPEIVFFNDFTTLLPDKILLEELEDSKTEGYKAVKNLEILLNKDFETIAEKNERQRKSAAEDESKSISANFQKDWQQKVYGTNTVKIIFEIQNNDEGEKEIVFSVQTKDNEYLAPRKRSKGMIWFLSLWLELKAKENDHSLILLFDEPGLHLHIKANKDMLRVFHKLIEKGHQVIYSTHSPSLIETDKLHNIGLVINTEKEGTKVEGLTSAKINSDNKRDALQPIAEAMGMEPLKDFSVLKQKNVLLEGLSDFWYFKGMLKILNKNTSYEFIPGIGIKGNQMKPLISFCLGYGLDWLLVMDGGDLPKKFKTEIKEDIFSNDQLETDKKVFLTKEKEIENLFDLKDVLLIDNTLKSNSKSAFEAIGSKNKVVFSKLFYQKVMNNEIKKEDLSENTINRFIEVFKWIEASFEPSLNQQNNSIIYN